MSRRRKNRLVTDAFREIRATFSRFLSILVLSALAVAFLAGLRTTAPDMEHTADNYYDRANFMDGYVVSTLGLTEDDLTALAAAPGVAAVEGDRTADAVVRDKVAVVRALPAAINLPELIRGRMPEAPDECVTEKLMLVKLGVELGDTVELTLSEDHEDDLARTAFTVVGVADSPLYVGTDRGSSSMGTGSADGFVYIPAENFTMDYYTAAYLVFDGLAGMDSYSDDYDDRLEGYLDSLDGLKEERARARYDQVVGDAQAELDDAQAELAEARAELDSKKAEADQELADARKELDDGWEDYREGQDTYRREIADAERELADALRELRDGERELADARQEYADGVQEYQDGLQDYEEGRLKYEDGLREFEENRAKLVDAQKEADDARQKLVDGQKELDEKREEAEDGQKELDKALRKLRRAQAEVDDGYEQAAEAEAQLAEAKTTLDAGEQALNAALAAKGLQLADLQAAWPAQSATYEALAALAAAGALPPAQQVAYDSLKAVKDVLDQADAIEQGRAEYEAGLRELRSSYRKLEAAQEEIDDGYAEARKAQKELKNGLKQLDEAQQEIDDGWVELNDALAELDDGWKELNDAQVELDDARAELDDARRELEDARVKLEDGAQEIADAEQKLADGWRDYRDGQQELEDARVDGRQELDDALKELEDGEKEYADGLVEYEDGKKEADEKIADAEEKLADAERTLADARRELAEVEDCKWYVLGRNTNAGFEGYAQDAERVGNLANIFPLIFFLVAGLACLTTMTRMVEDQRTQIGCLKALGFSRFAISRKYLGYALMASLLGGVLGLVVGCTLIPLVIANAFNIMYNVPPLQFKPQLPVYVLSVGAAVLVTTGAALWACLSTLMDTPANLMRPRSPKAGRRVFLERVGFIWKRLSFTWKVTVRNLFRYQKRFWMTVVGIGGCTALIVTGFGLHESIFDILDKQFDEISLYDATVGLDDKAEDSALAEVADYLDNSPAVERWCTTSIHAAEASSDGPARSINIYAVGDWDGLRQFIDLRHRLDDRPVTLPEDGVLITEKLSELLGVGVGDTITLDKDGRVEVTVTDVVENYVYHYVYMTEELYRSLFREEPEANTVLLAYAPGIDGLQSDELSTTLMFMDAVGSYSYIATLRDTFTNSMHAINYAVIIIIAAAAALAFVVLYNLTNINITERIRELATLKVLGFYDMETTMYVYRENIFLMLFGIVLGLFLGRWMHAWLVTTVEVDIVMFGRTAPPYSYWLAGVLTVVFSAMVNIAAHFKLKKVDMVESLKTVE